MTRAGSRTLPSRSHVSSMTGECTYSIYYQRVVSVDKGSVISRYKKKQNSLPKKVPLRRRTPLSRGPVSSMTSAGSRTLFSPSHVSSMTSAGSRTLFSRSHVSSMTGEGAYPIYHQNVVNVENGTLLHHLVYGECIRTDTIISASDALMLVTHLYHKPVV